MSRPSPHPWTSAPLLVFVCAAQIAAAAVTQGQVTRRLLPIPDLPDAQLSRLEPVIQRHIRRTMERLHSEARDPSLTRAQRATAYGEAGRVLQAYHQLDAAEPCYRNAALLAPQDFRWPYYLGYVYQIKPALEQAVASYERALALRPQDQVTKLRLAQAYRDLNQLDRAWSLLKELSAPELRAATLLGLGRIALARRDYRAAVEDLTAASKADPAAGIIHYPLAMAYRGLGQMDKALEQVAKRGEGEPAIPDPVIDGLEALVVGVRVNLERAYDAVQLDHYDEAAEAYGKAVALDPSSAANRVSYARALHLAGRRPEATRQLKEALRLDADNMDGNFFLGVIEEEEGDDQAAMVHYRKTLALDPAHAQAQYYLANALMRAGRYAEALPHYRVVLRYVPQNMFARLMEALAMWRTGAPDREVLVRLEEARAINPDYADFAVAIARLRATSADPAVRDADKALALGQELYAHLRTPDFAAVVAMAYAALGRFEQAVALQKEGIFLALKLARPELVSALSKDLAHYRTHQPREKPWDLDDAVFRPVRLKGS